jgi:hypothetical protein
MRKMRPLTDHWILRQPVCWMAGHNLLGLRLKQSQREFNHRVCWKGMQALYKFLLSQSQSPILCQRGIHPKDGSNHLYPIVMCGNPPTKNRTDKSEKKYENSETITNFYIFVLGGATIVKNHFSVSWFLFGDFLTTTFTPMAPRGHRGHWQTFRLLGVCLPWSMAGGSSEHHLSEPSDHQLAGAPNSGMRCGENHGKPCGGWKGMKHPKLW